MGHMILTGAARWVVLIRGVRTGSQAAAAIGAQQGQPGAAGPTIPPAGTAGTGRRAG